VSRRPSAVAVARPPRSRASWGIAAAALALVVWSAHGAQVDPATLFGGEAVRQIGLYLAKLVPPDLSSTTLSVAARGAVETFAISFVGSLLAVVLALPLAIATTRTLLYRGVLYEGQRRGRARRIAGVAVYVTARAILNVFRTIPEIVWAIVFVFLVGLGPFAGVLALGLHTSGVLGKLFGEVLEDVDPRPLEALQATGATRRQILLYGVLPQAAPQFLSYALYRWEVNIRAATIMGFVGAGGLGTRIHVAISLFLERELLTLILAIYVIVTVVDALSAWLRARLG
jgi:phosphonate transport system permease protein